MCPRTPEEMTDEYTARIRLRRRGQKTSSRPLAKTAATTAREQLCWNPRGSTPPLQRPRWPNGRVTTSAIVSNSSSTVDHRHVVVAGGSLGFRGRSATRHLQRDGALVSRPRHRQHKRAADSRDRCRTWREIGPQALHFHTTPREPNLIHQAATVEGARCAIIKRRVPPCPRCLPRGVPARRTLAARR